MMIIIVYFFHIEIVIVKIQLLMYCDITPTQWL